MTDTANKEEAVANGTGTAVHTLPVQEIGRLPIEALHDVELNVEVTVGRARMALRDLLTVRPRSTIQLDRPLRSPVDIMVNGTLFARGEMVAVDDSELGVQITEIIGVDPGGTK